MRIEFDPTNHDEATAVRAVLDAMYPQPKQHNYVHLEESGDEPSPTDLVEILIEGTAIGTPTVDSNGEPWDARIHSTPPTTNKDGTWRAKRGVKAEEIAEVRAEREAQTHDANLTASDAELIEQAQPLELPTEAPPVPLVEPAVSAPAIPLAPPANEPPSTPTPAPTPPAPTANVGTSAPSFLDVMKAITAAQKDGKIDTAKVKELCAAVGAGESTMGLNGPDNGDKRVAFMAALEETING